MPQATRIAEKSDSGARQLLLVIYDRLRLQEADGRGCRGCRGPDQPHESQDSQHRHPKLKEVQQGLGLAGVAARVR